MSVLTSDRLSLGFSCVGHTFSHLLMLLFPTVVLSLEVAWDMEFSELITMMLAGQILFGAAALPAGWLGDRWSVPKMMIIYFLGTGAACVATGFADTPFEMAVGLGATGLFAAIYHPVGIAWVARNPANRGKALGLNGVFGSFGVAGGAIVAGTMATLIDWRFAFFVPGALCMLTGVLLWLVVATGRVADKPAEAHAARHESGRGEMMRGVFVLIFTICCAGIIYQSTSFALPKMFEQRMAGWVDTTAGVGALVSSIYLFSAVAQLVGGWLADRYPLKRVYILAWMSQVPFLIIASSIAGPMLLPIAVIMVLSNTVAVPAENSLFAKFTPPAWRGTAFGVKFVVSLGVSAASVPLVGWMHGAFGNFTTMLLLLAAIAGAGVLIASLLPKEVPAAPSAQPAE